MSAIPSISYAAKAHSASVSFKANKPENKASEAFEGEAQLLKEIYNNYIDNIGGYQEINGHPVHVTTVLHTNKNAQNALLAIEKRLIDLGELRGNSKLPKIN